MTTLVCSVAPAATVTVRVSAPPEAVKPSPASLVASVVRPFFTPVDPVSSLPLPDDAYGEVARRVSVTGAPPLFLIDRLVTATLLSVMNLVTVACTEPPAYTLLQWLGACQRWLLCSVNVPGPSAIEYAAASLMLSQYATRPPKPITAGLCCFMNRARPRVIRIPPSASDGSPPPERDSSRSIQKSVPAFSAS